MNLSSLASSAFRSFVAAAILLGGGFAAVVACSSGGSGNIGDPCHTPDDCNDPSYECVAAYADGGCSKPLANGDVVKTCQQTCSSQAQCDSLQGNYVCSPPGCNTPDVSELCRPGTP